MIPSSAAARTKKNILVLDGGGLKGVFTLVILRKIEEMAGTPLRDLFDLIVGCSTGGVIALGAGLLGKTCAEGTLVHPLSCDFFFSFFMSMRMMLEQLLK